MMDAKNQKRVRPRSAFIVCEPGSDIHPLVVTLQDLGLKTLNLDDVTTAGNPIRSTRELIERADVVLAVLGKRNSPNVFLELGFAIGSQRPVAIIGQDAVVSSDLADMFWIRATLDDRAALTFQLKAYLSNLNPRTTRRRATQVGRPAHASSSTKLVTPGVPNSNLERDLLNAFQLAVEVASIAPEPRTDDHRGYIPDFAIWTVEPPTVMESPVIVEVKGRNVSEGALERAVEQLRAYAVASDVSTGLLIIADLQAAESKVANLSPLIIVLGLAACKRLLADGKLVDTLRRERNRYAHSAA